MHVPKIGEFNERSIVNTQSAIEFVPIMAECQMRMHYA